MSPRSESSCAVIGAPCMRVLDDVLIELARVAQRETRPVGPCECGERNRIALGGSSRCYRCKVAHEFEGDHVHGSGEGPVVMQIEANTHRIVSEGERIWRAATPGADLCDECRSGFPLRIAAVLARLDAAS